MDYRKRERIIHMMGFRSYSEYLKSPLWKAIRRDVLGDGQPCYGCGEPAYELHHQNYKRETLEGKRPWRLVPVCRDCHREAELAHGRKVSIEAANRRLRLIRERHRRLAAQRAMGRAR